MINEKALYIWKSEFKDDYSGLALGVSKTAEQNWDGEKMAYGIVFFDTNRFRGFYGDITIDGDTITVKRPMYSKPVVLKICTLEMFKQKYYKLASGGAGIAAACKTDEELWAWYRKSFLSG